jgi:DNA-3-methyladenine glycosylase
LGKGLKRLPREFFDRNTLAVAKELLGKILIVRDEDELGGRTVSRIVETEAYRGTDPASHCARGPTPRASMLFGEPGRAYVYFIYGMYEMLNFVTEPEGKPGAVLIRALEPIEGEERMRERRGRVLKTRELLSGPGKLCRALGITLADNGASVVRRSARFAVADDGFRPARIAASPRVGISVATDKLWRFFIPGHPCVSRAPQNRAARVVAP